MSAPTDSNLLSRVFDWLMARSTSQDELAAISHLDLHHLATDLGVTEAVLREAVFQATDHSILMDRMMRARGLDPETTRASFGYLMHEMAATCARCQDASLCRAELDAGTADQHCHDFCGGAKAIDLLKWRETHQPTVDASHNKNNSR